MSPASYRTAPPRATSTNLPQPRTPIEPIGPYGATSFTDFDCSGLDCTAYPECQPVVRQFIVSLQAGSGRGKGRPDGHFRAPSTAQQQAALHPNAAHRDSGRVGEARRDGRG